MKSFLSYLTESTRTYDFRIRIACEMSDDIMGKLKTILEMYKLESISKPRRLPIQETPEFPNMGPVEVNVIDIVLGYPTNDEKIRSLIAECGCVPAACVRVTPTNSPYELVRDGKEISNLHGKPGESVLMQAEMVAEKKDEELVGDARIPGIMKELQDTRKYKYPDAAGGEPADAKTSNSYPQGQTSPVGTHKNSIPSDAKLKAGK